MAKGANMVTRVMEPEQFTNGVSAKGMNIGAFYDPDRCLSCGYIERDLRPNGGLNEILEKHDVRLFLVSTELHRELANQFNFRYIPHFIAYKDGEIVGEEAGYRNPQSFEEMIIGFYNL